MDLQEKLIQLTFCILVGILFSLNFNEKWINKSYEKIRNRKIPWFWFKVFKVNETKENYIRMVRKLSSFMIILMVLFAALILNSCSNRVTHSSSTVSKILPVPKAEFFLANQQNFNRDFTYLETYFVESGKREYFKDSIVGDSFNWKQCFKDGISVNHKGVESGINVRITFPGYSKKEVLKFMNWFYESAENSWNNKKTEYSPVEGGAGCYYEIQQDSLKQYVIEYYCGC